MSPEGPNHRSKDQIKAPNHESKIPRFALIVTGLLASLAGNMLLPQGAGAQTFDQNFNSQGTQEPTNLLNSQRQVPKSELAELMKEGKITPDQILDALKSYYNLITNSNHLFLGGEEPNKELAKMSRAPGELIAIGTSFEKFIENAKAGMYTNSKLMEFRVEFEAYLFQISSYAKAYPQNISEEDWEQIKQLTELQNTYLQWLSNPISAEQINYHKGQTEGGMVYSANRQATSSEIEALKAKFNLQNSNHPQALPVGGSNQNLDQLRTGGR